MPFPSDKMPSRKGKRATQGCQGGLVNLWTPRSSTREGAAGKRLGFSPRGGAGSATRGASGPIVYGVLASARADAEGLAGRKRGESIDEEASPLRHLRASRLGRWRSVGLTDHPNRRPESPTAPELSRGVNRPKRGENRRDSGLSRGENRLNY